MHYLVVDPWRFDMTRIPVKLTVKEFELLSNLASDQLFRREFIDSRLPDYKSNPAEGILGKKLIERLRGSTERAKKIGAQMITPVGDGSGGKSRDLARRSIPASAFYWMR
ncbi:MAG TPA: helix-turn-helix domain-containing protein [Bryobacteraceae bacterium]